MLLQSQDRNTPDQMPRNLYSVKPLARQLRLFHERRTLQLWIIDEKCQLSCITKEVIRSFSTNR